jgi:hypothetical protein
MSRIISGASLAMVLFFSAGALDDWGLRTWGSLAWAAELPPPPLMAAAIEPKINTTPKITSKYYLDNLPQTLCVRGQFSSAHSSHVSGKSAHRQSCKFSYVETSPMNYEAIHLAPPGVGGNPSKPRNLWPKPQISAWDAAQKKRPQLVTSRMVCTQEITLAEIQQEISANLIELWKKLCIVRVTFFISL